jgi:hypothetical protein
MGQSDLEVLAVSVLGRATVDAGRWEEGLRLLEEAMAAARTGPRSDRKPTPDDAAACSTLTARD